MPIAKKTKAGTWKITRQENTTTGYKIERSTKKIRGRILIWNGSARMDFLFAAIL